MGIQIICYIISPLGQTAIWYLSGPTFIRGAYGPTIPSGWDLVATADFNSDGHPDYVLYNGGTGQTAIWYLNNNVYVIGGYGPTLPTPNWFVAGVADFNRDGHPDYVLDQCYGPNSDMVFIRTNDCRERFWADCSRCLGIGGCGRL